MNNALVADFLEKTADTIFTRGHCKGEMMNEVGNVCVIGAMYAVYIGAVVTTNYSQGKVYSDSVEHLGNKLCLNHTGRSGADIGGWNDLPETTAENVIDTLKEVAKDLRNEISSVSENNSAKE